MGILDIFKKNSEKSEKFKQMQEDYRLQKLLEERTKSSNERELDRFYEEERQKKIEQNLKEFREHRNQESQKTTILAGKPLFKGKGNIITSEATVLKNNDKLFSLKKSQNNKGMFFK